MPETTKNEFNRVYDIAKDKMPATMNSETLARQIVAAAQGDQRLAYDFMDTLNRHVTMMLQRKKQ